MPSVRTPSCLHTTSAANVSILDSGGYLVDMPTGVAIASMSKGALGTPLRWTAANSVPAVTTDSTVSFRSVGGIKEGGRIKVVLPSVGWSMPSAPVIEFSRPSAVNATAAWNAGTRTLLITTTSGEIAEGVAVELIVKDTVTPPSVTESGSASVETFERVTTGDTTVWPAIDTGSLNTSEIVAGALSNVSWALSANTPGVTNNATLEIIPGGTIGATDCIEIVLPEVPSAAQSWSMAGSGRVVEFVEPSSGAGVSRTEWDHASRTLLVITDNSTSITEGSKVILRIHDLTTPSSVIDAPYAVALTTYSSVIPDSTKIIDGPTSISGAAVPAGALTDGSWHMETDRPGEVSELDVRFTTSGELRSGSTIVLSLPHTLECAPAFVDNQERGSERD